MPERESSPPEQFEKKCELPDENIIECDENSELLKKLPRALKELPWPIEFQGTGQTIKEKKEFKVWYPKGDVFLSSVITIHELGHLRQAEINPSLDPERDFQNPKDHYESNSARENNANVQGWKRAQKYCPELLKNLEDKFQAAKQSGKLPKFKNFKELYDYFMELSMVINGLYEKFGLKKDKKIRKKFITETPGITEEELERKINEEAGIYVAEAIRADEKIYDLFKNTDNYRVGEKIDSDFARKFIKQASEKIAEENY